MKEEVKMKKLVMLLSVVLSFVCFSSIVRADDVDYSISDYYGKLILNKDYSANFEEKVTYHFDDDYNGQYVSLSLGGNLPENVSLDKDAIKVSATKNNTAVDVTYELSESNKFYKLKVYNSGQDGDTVTLTVDWSLKNLLFVYQDASVLNWKPITDWDVTLEKVRFDVQVPSESASSLKAHTGYFSAQPIVTKEGAIYHITTTNVKNTFELHAYWKNSIFDASSEQLKTKGKSDFLKTEENIKKNTQKAHSLFEWILPVVFIGLIIGGCLLYLILYRKMTITERSINLKARLYEAPEELNPLQLAQNVYHSPLIVAAPTSQQKTKLSFNNIIVASLLDLVEQGNLALREEGQGLYLVKIHDENLSDYESDLLDLAFGDASECACDELFSQYHMNRPILRKGSEIKPLRQKSKAYISNLTSTIKNIDKKVKQTLSNKGLTEVWRESNNLENSYLLLVYGCFLFAGIGSLGTFMYVMDKFNHAIIGYWVLITLAFGLLALATQFNCCKQGVLVKENALRYQYWHSFQNMINEIDTFDKAEIESIVIWDKLLVYATLFGEAKKVRKVMRLHKIHLSSDDMSIYVSNPLAYNLLYHSINDYSSSITIANQSQSINSSSGGTGGGFSSGGFSGGGGGGGGGAF